MTLVNLSTHLSHDLASLLGKSATTRNYGHTNDLYKTLIAASFLTAPNRKEPKHLWTNKWISKR